MWSESQNSCYDRKNLSTDDTKPAALLLSTTSGHYRLAMPLRIGRRGKQKMNAKRLALFGGTAVVLAGGLIYSLGIYPPASGRDGQGAIGERKVYRAEQPSDASVTPGAAPVAMTATAEAMKNHQIPELQNGQIFQLSNGQMFQLRDGQLMQLKDGQMLQLKTGQMLQLQNGRLYQVKDGQMHELATGGMYQLRSGQMMQLQNGQLIHQLSNGQMFQLKSGQMLQLNNGQLYQMNNGQLYQLNSGQLQAMFKQ